MKREILSPKMKKFHAHKRKMQATVLRRIHRNPLTFTCFNCGKSYVEQPYVDPKTCPNCKRSIW